MSFQGTPTGICFLRPHPASWFPPPPTMQSKHKSQGSTRPPFRILGTHFPSMETKSSVQKPLCPLHIKPEQCPPFLLFLDSSSALKTFLMYLVLLEFLFKKSKVTQLIRGPVSLSRLLRCALRLCSFSRLSWGMMGTPS